MDTILQFDHSLIFYVHEHFVYSFLTPISGIYFKNHKVNGALWIIIALLLMLQKKISRFRRGNYYCFRICIYNWRPRFKTKCSEIKTIC